MKNLSLLALVSLLSFGAFASEVPCRAKLERAVGLAGWPASAIDTTKWRMNTALTIDPSTQMPTSSDEASDMSKRGSVSYDWSGYIMRTPNIHMMTVARPVPTASGTRQMVQIFEEIDPVTCAVAKADYIYFNTVEDEGETGGVSISLGAGCTVVESRTWGKVDRRVPTVLAQALAYCRVP
jgi:hypothetical protein